MSLTYKGSKNAIPIAKIRETSKLIYLLPDSDVFQEIPTRNVNAKTFKCPYCKETFTTKTSLIHHVSHSCEKKKTIYMDTKAVIRLEVDERLTPLPQNEHEMLFITGAPNCGKTYFLNEYVKAYKKIFEREVFLFTCVEVDDTLAKDEELYIRVPIDDNLLEEPLKLEDLSNSLCVFDDIESSEYPKATNYAYSLLSQLCKAGRHNNISVAFINQECRMGKKTKAILTMLTRLVIFPQSASFYQTSKLLADYIGISKGQIIDILKMKSRWVVINRSTPQYVLYEGGAYMMGKEIFDHK